MILTPLTTVLSQESSAAYAHLGHHGSGTKNLLFAVLTDAHIHAALYTQRSRNDRGLVTALIIRRVVLAADTSTDRL